MMDTYIRSYGPAVSTRWKQVAMAKEPDGCARANAMSLQTGVISMQAMYNTKSASYIFNN